MHQIPYDRSDGNIQWWTRGPVRFLTYLAAGDVDGFLQGLFGSLAIILTAVILYPLVLFALGWLYGVIVAFIFNVVVGVSGGVTLTTKNEK